MTAKLNVVSINSRKGGVGKTSIGLSAAAQLAASGYKVAFIDLDTLGAHLAQCLPLTGVAMEDGDRLQFQRDDNGVSYRERPYLFWWLSGRPQTRGRSVLEAGQNLVVSKWCMGQAEKVGADEALRRMADNLTVFPASCYVSDLDEVNKMMLASDSQRNYQNFLSNLVSTLASAGHQFVFVDNSPGLSLNGAMSLNWVIKQARTLDPESTMVRFFTWTTTLASWWEQGLLEYEVNVFGGDLIRARPFMIVNRVPRRSTGKEGDEQHRWLEYFPVGSAISAEVLWRDAREGKSGDAATRLAEFKSLLFHLPLWIGAEKAADDLLLDFVLNHKLRVAVLGEDSAVARVTFASSRADEEDPMRGIDPSDDVRRWGRRAEDFFSRFFIPAAASRSPHTTMTATTFHKNIWSALVDQQLIVTSP